MDDEGRKPTTGGIIMEIYGCSFESRDGGLDISSTSGLNDQSEREINTINDRQR